jgi:hypothetical protein
MLSRIARIPIAYLFTVREIVRRQPVRAEHRKVWLVSCFHPLFDSVQRYDRAAKLLDGMQQREFDLRRQYFLQHGQHLPHSTLTALLDDFPAPSLAEYTDFDANLPAISEGSLSYLFE